MKIETDRRKVYFDIKLGSDDLGRVVFELYDDKAPSGADAFFKLCSESNSYKSTKFHRIIRNFMISGTASSESPSLPSIPFENQDDLSESFKLCISANDKHQIDPRNFFITFSPQPSLSRDHSVIGEVIHGKSILRELESVKTDDNHSPTVPIQITDCGEWTQGMPIPVYNASYSDIGGDIYEEYPMDDTNFNQESTEEAFAVSDKIKESGTLLFKKGEKQQARFKYRKSLRYVAEFIPDKDQDPVNYEKFVDLKKKLYLNLGLVTLQLGDYSRCVDYCTYLLDMEEEEKVVSKQDKTKALFRKGSAYVSLKKYGDGVHSLKLASELSPDDASITKALENAEKLVDQEKQKEKSKYSKFFK